MTMVLADTSIWVAFLNASSLGSVKNMKSLINSDQLCICPPVYQEILKGIKTKTDFNKIDKYLQYLHKIGHNPYTAAKGAAEIYYTMRKKGITIRKSFDCLIAWYTIEEKVPLYHNDRNFNLIAKHFPLKILEP